MLFRSDRADAVRREVADRVAEVTQLGARLEELELEARGVCGGAARERVQAARKSLRDILLKADVGITSHAWEVREEQQHRVNVLLTQKARQERLVDEEMRDALEDGAGSVFKDTKAAPGR